MLGYVLKGCDIVPPNVAEEDLQYGDWLRASPLKSHRGNAEAEIKEETKLHLAFQKCRESSKARQKLSFVDGRLPTPIHAIEIARHRADDVVAREMVVDAEMELVLGNKASKHKFEYTVSLKSSECKLRVVDDGEVTESVSVMAATAT